MRYLPSLLAAAALSGCATSLTPPKVPAALQPPAGQSLHLETPATGAQIYECSRKADGGYEWAFKGPEAVLKDRAGKLVGKHYGGPTWEGNDGSTVLAEVKARDPGPDPTAIPWLLLSAKSNSAYGLFSSTKSIQRVATTGGLAPKEACTAANLKTVARVPYTATYYFYR